MRERERELEKANLCKLNARFQGRAYVGSRVLSLSLQPLDVIKDDRSASLQMSRDHVLQSYMLIVLPGSGSVVGSVGSGVSCHGASKPREPGQPDLNVPAHDASDSLQVDRRCGQFDSRFVLAKEGFGEESSGGKRYERI